MIARIVSPSTAGIWNDYVHSHQHAIAWHMYEWGDLLKRHHNVDFFPLAALDGSKIRGVLPLYSTKTLLGGLQLISVPYFVAGGIISDNRDADETLLSKAISLSKKMRGARITLKHYGNRVEGDLLTDNNFYNLELDLRQGLDHIWDDLGEKNREILHLALKNNFQMDAPSENLDAFYKLYCSYNRSKGIPCVSRAWIHSLLASGIYSIALMKKNNFIVAGTLVKDFKNAVSFPLTCALTQDVFYPQVIFDLYWRLIEKFSNEGAKIFHSGRIPNTDSAPAYRLGWGGTKHSYYYQYYPNNSYSTEFGIKRGRKRKVFQVIWKNTPVILRKAIEPVLIKQFP